MSLSERTQQRLSSLISIIAEGEKKTEVLRQVLAEESMFEPFAAFNRLDQFRTGELTISDIVDFMSDNKIPLTKREAQYLFNRLDSNRDGKVTYRDFVTAVLPKENNRLSAIARDRDTYYIAVGMLLPFEIEFTLSKVFEQDILNLSQIVAAQELLQACSDFSSLDAFRCIDSSFLGYITLDSLDEFTKANGNSLSTDELLAFFRVVDLDEDGRISYSELLEAITSVPKYFNRYLDIQDDLRRSRQLERELRDSRNRIERFVGQSPVLLRQKTEEIEQEIRDSLERDIMRKENIYQSQKLENRLKRSRELSESLKLSRERQLELEYAEFARKNELRALELDNIVRSQERLNQIKEQRIRQEIEEEQLSIEEQRLASLIRSRQYQEELSLSQARVEQLRRIQQEQEQIRRDLERNEIQQELRESREKIELLEKDHESFLTAPKQNFKPKTQSKIISFGNRYDQSRTSEQSKMSKSATFKQPSPYQSRYSDKVEDSAKITQSRIYQTPKKQEISQSKKFTTPNRQSGIKQSKLKSSLIKQTAPRQDIKQSGSSQRSRLGDSRLQEKQMSPNEEAYLTQIFKDQIGFNRELDEMKSQLAFKQDFHPSSAFTLLDPKERGHFTKLDFEIALNNLDLYPTTEQIRLFYSRFSPDSSFLDYKAFLAILLPQSEQYQELMLSRKPEKMSFSTTVMFKNLLKKHFQVEESLEELRRTLGRRSQFNVNQAFDALDKDNQGFITINEFKEIFRKNGVFATNRDVEGLVNFYDKNKDGRVSFQDFVTEISPKRRLIL